MVTVGTVTGAAVRVTVKLIGSLSPLVFEATTVKLYSPASVADSVKTPSAMEPLSLPAVSVQPTTPALAGELHVRAKLTASPAMAVTFSTGAITGTADGSSSIVTSTWFEASVSPRVPMAAIW